MKSLPATDDDRQKIGLRLKILANQIGRALDLSLAARGWDITTLQCRILAFIDREGRNGEILQRDVERAFDMRRSTVTGTLKLMEKNGFVYRVEAESDARLKKIGLTPKGRALRRDVAEFLDRAEDVLRQSITDEEYERFRAVLDKLGRAAEEKLQHL